MNGSTGDWSGLGSYPPTGNRARLPFFGSPGLPEYLNVTDPLEDRIAELTAAIQNAQWHSKADLRSVRRPSLAERIGQHPATTDTDAYRGGIHPALKAALGYTASEYIPGTFITALANLKGNPDEYSEGKAALASMGLAYRDMPEVSKATLGTTGATGGYVLPNNLVDTVAKPAVAEAIYSQLVTIRSGVNVRGVDQPLRTGAPSRMTFQDWGNTKTNVNEVYSSYTANLATMGAIYDVSKQYMRFSAGAAEQDVLDELTKAATLAENYYILAGAGTGTVGSGDPTTGIYVALNAASAFNGYVTTFSGPSNSTIAGAAATGISQALGKLAGRNRRATAIVTDAVTYFTIISQGSDNAGYWLDPRNSGGFTFNVQGGLTLWGVPLLWDPNFDNNTGTTKCAIAADWTVFKLYRGLEFRVDMSEEAGTRWDQNLIGSTQMGPWLQ